MVELIQKEKVVEIMRVALINPELFIDSKVSSPELDIGENIGIGILASILRKNEINAHIFNIQNSESSIKNVINRITAYCPDLIGLTMMSQTYPTAMDIMNKLKDTIKSPIVVGGILPTILKKRLLLEFDPKKVIDFLIYGDGELSLIELANYISWGNKKYYEIKGLIWRNEGEIIENEYRPLLFSLDDIPFPARDMANRIISNQINKKFEPSLRIISSRGCYGTCLFCHIAEYYKATNQKPAWRYRSAKNIIDELSELKTRYSINRFFISDDNFFGYGKIGKKRAFEIANLLKKEKLNIKFCIQARIDSLDLDLLKKPQEVGLISIDVGIETINPETLRFFNKTLSLKTILSKFDMLTKLKGIHIGVYMLNIHPFSSISETSWNYEFLHEIGHFSRFSKQERDKEVYRKLIATRLEITKYTRAYTILKEKSLLKKPFKNNPVMYDFIIENEEMMNFYRSCIKRVKNKGTENFDNFFIYTLHQKSSLPN